MAGKVAGGAAGALTTGAGASAWAAGAAALPWVAGGVGVVAGLYAMRRATQDAGYDGMTSGERLRQQRGGSMRDTYRRAWGYDGVSGPEVSDTMKFGTGVGGDKGTVTAALTGSAEVKGEAKLTIGVSSQFITLVERAEQAIKLAGSLHANGPGSTGKSSPDAAAPSVGASGSW